MIDFDRSELSGRQPPGFRLRRFRIRVVVAALLWVVFAGPVRGDDLVIVHRGDLPIVLSAPHGGRLPIPDCPMRTGEDLAVGPSGFVTVRDSWTEELALDLADRIAAERDGRPWLVVSRVDRRYVDFNRPVDIAVEHPRARVVYDIYHDALRDACREVRRLHHGAGLLLDLHGQGSSPETLYRGTQNGRTVTQLRTRFGESAHSGENSFAGLLRQQGWRVHPDPFDGREQSGYSGGYIVRTYGSHRADGIDAIQLELGRSFRVADQREQTARELATAVAQWVELYLPQPAAQVSPQP